MKALIREWVSLFEIIQYVCVQRPKKQNNLKGDIPTSEYLATSRLSIQAQFII
jgi:hypothetical protein